MVRRTPVVVVGGALVGLILVLGVGAARSSDEPDRGNGEPSGEEVHDGLVNAEGHLPVIDRSGTRVGYVLAEDLDTHVEGVGPHPVVYDFDGRRIGEMAPGFVRDGEDAPNAPVTSVAVDEGR